MEKLFRLDNKVAIVTGGSTGLGYAISKCFVESGAKVIITGRTDLEKGKDRIKQLGENAQYYEFDITDSSKTKDFVEKIIEDYGKIDILINNAGNHCKKLIEDMSVEEYISVLNVHLTGAFALSKEVFPYMKKCNSGSIIFQASMTSYIGMPAVAGYSTAKSGVLGLMRSLAVEGGNYNIRVNAIAPGWIDTDMFRKATENDDERFNKIKNRILLGTIGKPEDIGLAATFLSSDAAKYITGVCLPVDGGGIIGF